MIDVDTVPTTLSIENVAIIDQDLHIKWNADSNQATTIIPMQFLINNDPKFDPESYNEPAFETARDLKFFDYRGFFDQEGAKNKKNVYT